MDHQVVVHREEEEERKAAESLILHANNCQLKYENELFLLQNNSLQLPVCPPVWDSLFCWPPYLANQTASIPCREIFSIAIGYQNNNNHDHNNMLTNSGSDYSAFRFCDSQGVWSSNGFNGLNTFNGWTNYNQCLTLLAQQSEEARISSDISIILGFIVWICSIGSLITLIIALVIFISFRSLQCARIRVHKNLCFALLLHCFILIIMSSSVVFVNSETPRLLPQINWLCKCLKLAGIYSSMSVVNWMFLEGFLLHARIYSSPMTSDGQAWWHSSIFFNLIGWAFPAFFVIIWSLVLELTEETARCWQGYGKSKTIWIVTTPMIAALTVNFAFLVNIVRVLVVKLRKDAGDAATLKAIRATAFLIPLLGIEHLIFCINPSITNRQLESVYLLVNGLIQSIQGMAVSILYCFANHEVRSALMNAWSRKRLSYSVSHSYSHSHLKPINNHQNINNHNSLSLSSRLSEAEQKQLLQV